MSNSIKAAFREGFKDFIPEMRQRLRDDFESRIQEACFMERENNIATAATAMIDAGVPDADVAHMLQKHWDLRLSETGPFINWAHKQLAPQA